jgi:hypothetical protein
MRAVLKTVMPDRPCQSFNEWQEHLRRERELYYKLGSRYVQDKSEVPKR